MTRNQLKELASGNQPIPKPKVTEVKLDKSTYYYRLCHKHMKDAAKKGKFYCEVTIPWDLYDRLAILLAEFSPSVNGDGYTHTVICLRWD